MPSILSLSSTSNESAPPRPKEIIPLPSLPRPPSSSFFSSPPLQGCSLSSLTASMTLRAYILETLSDARSTNHSRWLSRARLPPPKGGGTCCRRHGRCCLVISPTTVAMLIHPTSSHLVTVDADINIVAVVNITAMMLNATTVGGQSEENRASTIVTVFYSEEARRGRPNTGKI